MTFASYLIHDCAYIVLRCFTGIVVVVQTLRESSRVIFYLKVTPYIPCAFIELVFAIWAEIHEGSEIYIIAQCRLRRYVEVTLYCGN